MQRMKPLLFLVFAIGIGAPAMADPDARQIRVQGEGQAEAAPDMATIRIGVTHESETAADAMAATSEGVKRILDRLAQLGIEARDLQTRRLTLNPVWAGRNTPDGDPRITGFVASNALAVRVRDLARLGVILTGVIEDGANDFDGLEFSVQDPQPLADAARREAVEDARHKAKVIAAAAGVQLGDILSIVEGGAGRPAPMPLAAAREASMPVAAGEVQVSASVTIIFEIAP